MHAIEILCSLEGGSAPNCTGDLYLIVDYDPDQAYIMFTGFKYIEPPVLATVSPSSGAYQVRVVFFIC